MVREHPAFQSISKTIFSNLSKFIFRYVDALINIQVDTEKYHIYKKIKFHFEDQYKSCFINLHSSLYFLQDINHVICLNPGLENGSNMGKEMQLELMAKMWPIKEPVSPTYGINTFSKIRKYHISIFFSLLAFSSDRNFHLYLFLLYEMKNVKNKFRDLHNMVKC